MTSYSHGIRQGSMDRPPETGERSVLEEQDIYKSHSDHVTAVGYREEHRPLFYPHKSF